MGSSLKVISDVFGALRRCRMLKVIDEYDREHLTLVAGLTRVARELDCCIGLYCEPETIALEHSSALSSRAFLELRNQTGIA